MIPSLLSNVYGKIVKIRNNRYDRGERLTIKVSVPVISVGNLSVGGTGKTPFVQMLVKLLKEMDKKPAIIGKGYKRKTKGELIICDGKKVLVSAKDGGDEMVLLAQSLKVPVIVHDSKAEAAVSAERRFDVDCIVVDDGFQHRALNRNLDIVLIDKDTLEKPELLPKGRLREPLESIKRANVVCLTGGAVITDKLRQLISFDAVLIKVRPVAGKPYYLGGSEISDTELSVARSKIIPVAGIAKPERFYSMLDAIGYQTLTPISFADHHSYNRNDIEKIRRTVEVAKTQYIAITEKDAAKLIDFKDRFLHYGIKPIVFPIELKITDGKNEFVSLIKLSLA